LKPTAVQSGAPGQKPPVPTASEANNDLLAVGCWDKTYSLYKFVLSVVFFLMCCVAIIIASSHAQSTPRYCQASNRKVFEILPMWYSVCC
jgi:hypothetical protein